MIFLKKIIFTVLAAWMLVAPNLTLAADIDSEKEYYYSSIDSTLQVNKDSTLLVEEHQVFVYQGDFHQGWRSIPLDAIGAIDEVVVIDGATGRALERTRSQLDKNDPSSWGKFTSFRKGNNEIIEWYYNLANTTHEWILRYKVHGAITFHNDENRLYWNVFSDFDRTVKKVSVAVSFPTPLIAEQLKIFAYRTFDKPIQSNFNASNQRVNFYAEDFYPHHAFTVDIGFPPHTVLAGAYWWDFVKIHWAVIASVLLVLFTIISAFTRWLLVEYLPQKRLVVIPQYEPPQQLLPAMAEAIVKEKITDKGWAATIVNLAVRGFIRIEEEQSSFWEKNNYLGMLIFNIVFFLVSLYVGYLGISIHQFSFRDFALIALALILLISRITTSKAVVNYKLIKLEKNWDALLAYEKCYLALLFKVKDEFSTREFKKSTNQTAQQVFSLEMSRIEKLVLKEIEQKTDAYSVKIRVGEKMIGTILFATVIVLVILSRHTGDLFPVIFFIMTLLSCVGVLWLYVRYEARLSPQGMSLKRDWLGFKMYLSVAERYRMQNLTPDIFEKYLPYAMIFGIEKKWAHAFAHVSMNMPAWYVARRHTGTMGQGSNFSSVAFSSSLSSSLATAFGTNSGAGRAGGGRAGGGGGGGGGGAS